ncbi:DUF4221 family protein [Marivirga sp.]|uniref:DUF4221 family protein n=1 Tax=Marivirga sp. TaxID=2018662 RepID=UPI003DA773CD
MNIKILSLIAVLFCLGCSSNQDFEHKSKLLTDKVKVKIPIDNNTSFSPFTMQYLGEGNLDLLAVSNTYTNSIDLYDLNNRKLFKKISINDSNRQYLDNFHGFYFSDPNTLMVYKRMSIASILSISLNDNFEPTEKKTITAKNAYNGSTFLNHASMTASPSIYSDNKFHFTILPLGMHERFGLDMEREPVEMIYDINMDSAYFYNVPWPEVYNTNNFESPTNISFRTKGHNNHFVYSWPASDSLVVRKPNGKYMKVNAKSKYFDESPYYDNRSLKNGQNISQLESNYYVKVLYDPFRKLYYRLGRIGLNNVGKMDNPTHYKQEITITILNEDFKIIDDVRLPGNQYLIKDTFIGKEGLYISNHNAFNEDVSEDEMSFTILKVENEN